MFQRLLSAGFVLFALAGARAELAGVNAVLVHEGQSFGEPHYLYTYDIQVTVTGADAWVSAGGPAAGVPWITLTGGTFFQSIMNDTNPPDPTIIEFIPVTNWTSFYTTHLAYPNIAMQGVSPGFTYGPDDQPTQMTADWYCPDNGVDYAGTFTIARFSIIEDVAGMPATAQLNMLVSSRETGPIPFTATMVTPEPAGLALLALGGLTLFRRR